MKKVIVRGNYPYQYEEFDDGTARCQCSVCNKWVELDSKKFEKIRTKGEWWKNFLCLNCWKKGKDGDKVVAQQQREVDIMNGQAYNNAVQAVLVEGLTPGKDENAFWDRVEVLQVEFFEHLKKIKNLDN